MAKISRIPQGDKVSMSTGVIYGGIPKPNAGDDTKFDLSETGYRYVQRAANGTVTVTDHVLPAVTAGTPPDIATQTSTLLYIDPSDIADPLKYGFLELSDLQRRTLIELGDLIHLNNANISAGVTTSTIITDVASQVHDIFDAMPFTIISGNDVAPKAGVNMELSKDVGVGQARGRGMEDLTDGWLNPNSKDLPALATVTLLRTTQTGLNIVPNTVIDPNLWDNAGTAETIANPDEATIARMYQFADNEIIWMLGQEKFSTFTAAQTAEGNESFITPAILNTAEHIYSVIVLKTATDTNDLAEFELRKKF